MEYQFISRGGKRVIKAAPKTRISALLLAISMLFGMVNLPGMQAEAADTLAEDIKNQVVDSGGTIYYDANGKQIMAAEDTAPTDYAVSVSKKVSQFMKDGNPVENKFAVGLSVATSTDYKTVEVTQDAAVLLVVDVSFSMVDECAECGRAVNTPKPGDIVEGPGWPALTSYSVHNRAQAHCAPGTTEPKSYCPLITNANMKNKAAGFFSIGANGKCKFCAMPRSEHKDQHVPVSRLNTAKKVLAEFLTAYAAGGKGASRELAVVTFSDLTQGIKWGDKPSVFWEDGVWKEATDTSAAIWENVAAKTSEEIEGFVSKIFASTGNGTRTPDGMDAAYSLLGKLKDMQKKQSSVILMTDGLPTAQSRDAGNYSGVFAEEYASANKYLKDNNSALKIFDSGEKTFKEMAAIGFRTREAGASLYTVSFASGYVEDDLSLTEPNAYYLSNYLKLFADEGYDANTADLLKDAFTDIIKKMVEYKPNTITDTLPPSFTVEQDSLESGASVKSAGVRKGTNVLWNLSGKEPSEVVGERNIYKASYVMTLDNIDAEYTDGTANNAVNKEAPTFRFQAYEDTGATVGPQRTVLFDKTAEVKSYSADYSFTKVDPAGNAIEKPGSVEAAQFQLYRTSRGDWAGGINIINDKNGKVNLLAIPSGQSYTLEETKPPLDYALDTITKWTIAVEWGAIVTKLDKDQVINKHDTYEESFTIRKQWEGSENFYKDKTVKFSITEKGTSNVLYNGAMNIENAVAGTPNVWEKVVPLPTRDDMTGDAIAHVITEEEILGCTTQYTYEADTITITNTISDKQEITVKKVWVDPEPEPPIPDETGIVTAEVLPIMHPAATIVLYLDSSAGEGTTRFEAYTFEADTKSEVAHTFKNVPVTDKFGNAYTYHIEEEGAIPGYELTKIEMTTKAPHFILTNTSTKAITTVVPFHKHWVGDDPLTRPSSIAISLQASYDGGTTFDDAKDTEGNLVAPITLSEANQIENRQDVWEGTFVNLPRFVEGGTSGTAIQYKLYEADPPEGYSVKYSTIDVINTLNKTSVTVHKTWRKPNSITAPNATFMLYRNGELKTTGMLMSGQSTYVFQNLDTVDGSGQPYNYTVEEDAASVSDYEVKKTTDTSFTNTLKQKDDVTVSGSIRWELRNMPESEVMPKTVTLWLYAGTQKVATTTCAANSEGKWNFEFKTDDKGNKLPRYTEDRMGVVSYSVREVGQSKIDGEYDKAALDKTTVMFNNKNFGAHYDDVVTENNNHFICNMRNHTDTEVFEYMGRIDRVYTHYVDGQQASSTKEIGASVTKEKAFDLQFSTDDFVRDNNGNSYVFISGDVGIGASNTRTSIQLPDIKQGTNTVRVSEIDGIFVVTLNYERYTTSSGGGGGDRPPDPPKPVDPVVPPVDPPIVPPVDPPIPPVDPPIPPINPPPIDPPVVTPPSPPDIKDRVDEAERNPDIIIRDKDELKELYPELDINDLPIPLYRGPNFSIIQGPNGELIVIDSSLVPLGLLPKTGGAAYNAALLCAWMSLALLVAALTCRNINRKNQRDEN